MRRPIFGSALPAAEDSLVGDVFINIETNKRYIFDDGAWQEVPQPDTEIPAPTSGDSGKVLGVGSDGKYKLVSGGGGGGVDIPTPTQSDAGKLLGVDENGDYSLVEGGSAEAGYSVTTETIYDEDIDWQEEGGKE